MFLSMSCVRNISSNLAPTGSATLMANRRGFVSQTDIIRSCRFAKDNRDAQDGFPDMGVKPRCRQQAPAPSARLGKLSHTLCGVICQKCTPRIAS